MSFVSSTSSNKRRKQTKTNRSASQHPPPASIFANSSPSPSKPTNLCSKVYSPKEIVAALMEEQPQTVEKKRGSDVKYSNWKCKNPACNGKVVKCIVGKGFTNAFAHLQSKQCYGSTGTSLQVSTLSATTTMKQSTTTSSLTFLFLFLSFLVVSVVFFVVFHLLEGPY